MGGCHGVEELVLRFCIDLESVVWSECWSRQRGSDRLVVVLDLGYIVVKENISEDQPVPAPRSFIDGRQVPRLVYHHVFSHAQTSVLADVLY